MHFTFGNAFKGRRRAHPMSIQHDTDGPTRLACMAVRSYTDNRVPPRKPAPRLAFRGPLHCAT
jgi:hypothetical protein